MDERIGAIRDASDNVQERGYYDENDARAFAVQIPWLLRAYDRLTAELTAARDSREAYRADARTARETARVWAGKYESCQAGRDADAEMLRTLAGQLDIAIERAEAERDRADRLAAVLRRVEWVDPLGEDVECCPVCEGREWQGHAPDCDLAAALAAKGV